MGEPNIGELVCRFGVEPIGSINSIGKDIFSSLPDNAACVGISSNTLPLLPLRDLLVRVVTVTLTRVGVMLLDGRMRRTGLVCRSHSE